jgi:hypothetical protein
MGLSTPAPSLTIISLQRLPRGATEINRKTMRFPATTTERFSQNMLFKAGDPIMKSSQSKKKYALDPFPKHAQTWLLTNTHKTRGQIVHRLW